MSDAAKRAAARKAKILARGNAGLHKLAQTARGEEAEKLYGNDSPKPSSSPGTPPDAAPRFGGLQNEPELGPGSGSGPESGLGGGPQLSAEQRQMQEQLAAMFGSLGAPSPWEAGGAGQQGDVPGFQHLMAQMMGQLGADRASAGAGAGTNLVGNGDGSDAFAGLDPSQNPFAALQSLESLAGGGGGGGIPGLGPPSQKSKVDKYFALVHCLAVLAFAVFSIGWWEPALRATSHPLSTLDPLTSWSSRWVGLAGGRDAVRVIKQQVLGRVEFVPIFWAFTTLELILQTTRFFILKSPPPPHSLIANFLPFLPPGLSRPILTGSRYISLISQTYKDGALLIFLVGSAIILASYLNGTPLPQA